MIQTYLKTEQNPHQEWRPQEFPPFTPSLGGSKRQSVLKRVQSAFQISEQPRESVSTSPLFLRREVAIEQSRSCSPCVRTGSPKMPLQSPIAPASLFASDVSMTFEQYKKKFLVKGNYFSAKIVDDNLHESLKIKLLNCALRYGHEKKDYFSFLEDAIQKTLTDFSSALRREGALSSPEFFAKLMKEAKCFLKQGVPFVSK